MRIRFIFPISFLISFFLTPFIINFCFKLGILDYPDARKIHNQPTPRLGGLAIYLATMLALGYNILLSAKLISIFFAASLIFIISLIDDLRPLSALIRLAAQVIATAILIFSGIYIEFFPKSAGGLFLNYILTLVWVVGITNAVNYLDGLDGLLILLTLSVLACFGFIGYISDQFWLLSVIVALAGSLLGFLKYNFPRAKIFIGDAGSTFIGFILATVSIMGTWAQDNVVKVFVPVFILGVPIFDMCFTTVMRIKEGKVKSIIDWLEYAGCDHFHHRLLNIGLSRTAAVYLICVVSLMLGISGIILYNSERTDAYLMLLQVCFVFMVISILMLSGEKNTFLKGR
ncbi:MAG: undecaprenyl/decaprenyl-phosphate alpha-N-acetylglucosaminyl 1-phosphate transferase [Candidatus Omnitrophica bacterium]|nr:undecaprenyl/decaprenyl-phosphate alpha-N-acetylglucosaminyl 1-phosphate transferase [Candidatus Omnitrophota bacterium]